MNRIVAITGGFGHLGSVVGQAFADAGWKVALLDRAVGPRYPQAGALSVGGIDLTDPAAARAALEQVNEHFGGLDALTTWPAASTGKPWAMATSTPGT